MIPARTCGNNTVATICQASLSNAMKQIGEKFALVLENTCITTPLVDTDTSRTGVQPDCQVRDRLPRDEGGFVEHLRFFAQAGWSGAHCLPFRASLGPVKGKDRCNSVYSTGRSCPCQRPSHSASSAMS